MNNTFIFRSLIRIRDLIVAIIGLIILSPIFLIIAIQITRDSYGPVFFRGARVGKNGKFFHILKFRTMHEKPESYHGPKITGENDPRITRLGGWLRETKLNELPQLWNVLIGEMSLIGPRPEDPAIVETWPKEIKKEILSIRPGITSPASILFRDEETMLTNESLMETYFGSIQPDKLRLDQLYVRHRSFWVDIDVLLWTFIGFFPGLSKTKPPERLLLGGLISRGADYMAKWFVTDFFIAFISVSASALFWRTFGPFNIGFLRTIIEAILFAVVFTVTATLFGIQKIQWDKASPSDVLIIAASSLISALILLAANQFQYRLPPILIISGAIIAFFTMVVARYRYRLFTGFASRLLRFRKGGNIYRERILIIGSGDAGSYAAWMLLNSKESMRFHVIGYLDDDFQKHGFRFRGIEVLGGIDDLEKIIVKHDVGIILFAIHNIQPKKREEILRRCYATPAEVVIFPDILSHLTETRNLGEESVRDNGQKYLIEMYPSGKNMDKTLSSFSNIRKQKLLAILEELKINIENSEINKCFENISLINEMIFDSENEEIND